MRKIFVSIGAVCFLAAAHSHAEGQSGTAPATQDGMKKDGMGDHKMSGKKKNKKMKKGGMKKSDSMEKTDSMEKKNDSMAK